jgi:hypothetical protein
MASSSNKTSFGSEHGKCLEDDYVQRGRNRDYWTHGDFDLERQDTDQGRLDVDFFVFDFLSPENAQEVLETKGLAGDRVA